MAHRRKPWPEAKPGDKKIPGKVWNDLLRTVAGLSSFARTLGYQGADGAADAPPHYPVFRCVQLDDDLDPSQSDPDTRDATGTVLYWDHDDEEWKKTDPAHPVSVSIAPWQESVLAEDAKTFVYYHPQRGKHIPVFLPSEIQRFTCSTALAPNQGNATTADAYRVYYDSDASEYKVDTSDTFTVTDLSGTRRAPAYNASYWERVIGTAWKAGDDDNWAILHLPHQAKWIEFAVNDAAGFATTDSTATVDGCTYHDGYEPFTAITTVYNMSASTNYVFEGDDDDKGKAQYDIENDRYEIYQMECP